MPKPRNESVDSRMMTLATSSVACTMIGAIALGSRWRKMIRPSRLPSAFAASANSRSRSDRNDARTSRATDGHDKPADQDDDDAEVQRRLVRRAGDDRGQHEQQRQQRDGEHDVGRAHDDEVDPAAVVAGDRAQERADRDLHDHREQRDRERDARAEHQAREQVAAVLVGAQDVVRDARRERVALPVHLVDEVGVGRREDVRARSRSAP